MGCKKSTKKEEISKRGQKYMYTSRLQSILNKRANSMNENIFIILNQPRIRSDSERIKGNMLNKSMKGRSNNSSSTGASEGQIPKLLTSLEKEAASCKGSELISKYKICFDQETGRAIGFLRK